MEAELDSVHPELMEPPELPEPPQVQLTLQEHLEQHPELLTLLHQEEAMVPQVNTLAAPPELLEPVELAIFQDQDTNHTMQERTENNDLISYEFLNIKNHYQLKNN